jgi:hypothetical protein
MRSMEGNEGFCSSSCMKARENRVARDYDPLFKVKGGSIDTRSAYSCAVATDVHAMMKTKGVVDGTGRCVRKEDIDPETGAKADMRPLRNGRSRRLWRTYLADDRSRR